MRYIFTKKENENMDGAWKLLEILTFNIKYITIYNFRNYIIKYVSENYSIEQFFLYETIIDKLYWNLQYEIAQLLLNISNNNDINNINNINEIPYSLTLCYKYKIDEIDINKKIDEYKKENNYYKSFVNKLIIIDKQKKILYLKEQEGTPKFMLNNYFNLLGSSIIINRPLYERIINNPSILRHMKIPMSQFYYEIDYAFPNFSLCEYNINDRKERTERIRKMYYIFNDNKNKDAKYWFKLMI